MDQVLKSHRRLNYITSCQRIESKPATICRLADELTIAGLIAPGAQSCVKFIDGKSPYEKASMMKKPTLQLDKDSKSPEHGSQLVAILDRVGFEHLTAKINKKHKCV